MEVKTGRNPLKAREREIKLRRKVPEKLVRCLDLCLRPVRVLRVGQVNADGRAVKRAAMRAPAVELCVLVHGTVARDLKMR